MSGVATITEALKYPFANWKRLFNYFWILVPVWGWFVVYGYLIRILENLRRGRHKELPAIHPFKGLFSTGFFLCVSIFAYTIILFALSLIPVLGWLIYIYVLLISPLLLLRYSETKKTKDIFDVVGASEIMFSHFKEYIIAWLKTIAFILILLVASLPLITLIVTLPAVSLGQYYFFGEFYREVALGNSRKSKQDLKKPKAKKRR